MAALKLHHVGIVQHSLEDVAEFMSLLGFEEDYRGYVDRWQCWCVFAKSVNGSTIEFVVPNGGPLARFNKGAGGLHHVAVEVPDICDVQANLEAQGIKLLEPRPIRGAGRFLCNFLSPTFTRGIQVEFIQVL